MTEVIWEPERAKLHIEDIPDFKSKPDWDAMRRLNPDKWQSIRTRCTQVESEIEQAMYIDLILEVVNLASTATNPTQADPLPSTLPDNLELALIKALAGKILDCEHGSTLLSTVSSIMDEMK